VELRPEGGHLGGAGERKAVLVVIGSGRKLRRMSRAEAGRKEGSLRTHSATSRWESVPASATQRRKKKIKLQINVRKFDRRNIFCILSVSSTSALPKTRCLSQSITF
jgi:hypothetical protein